MAPPGNNAAPAAGRGNVATQQTGAPVPDPAAGNMPAATPADLLDNARNNLIPYRERAPQWVKHEGVKLFTGYMDFLLQERPPGYESKICSLMNSSNLDEALQRYAAITQSLERATYGEKAPRTLDQMLIEKKVLEARVKATEEMRTELSQNQDSGSSAASSRLRGIRINQRFDTYSRRILSMRQDLSNLEAKMLEMQGQGRTQDFPADSTVALRQISLMRNFEKEKLVDFNHLPNETNDVNEKVLHAENPFTYRYKNWPKERIEAHWAKESAEAAAKIKAAEDARRAERLDLGARALVSDIESERPVSAGLRKRYYDAVYGNATDDYSKAIRGIVNSRNGGVTPSMKETGVISRVNTEEGRDLLNKIATGPRVFGSSSPYSNLKADDVGALLAYMGIQPDAQRAMGRVANEIPVGVNATYDHQVQVAGLHRLIENSATKAILAGDVKQEENVQKFLRDPNVAAALQSKMNLSQGDVDSLIREGINNIPGINSEAANLLINMARRVQDIERRPQNLRAISRPDVELIDDYVSRLERYNAIKFAADPNNPDVKRFNDQLGQVRRRVDALQRAPDIQRAGVPASQPVPESRPAAPLPTTFITPADPNNPDPIQSIAGMTLNDLHKAFDTYKILRQNFDPAKNPEQFSALRKAFGSLTHSQRENLVIIAKADLQDPKDAKLVTEFVELINDLDKKNAAVFLLNETHRLAILEQRNPQDAGLTARRERLNQFIQDLPTSERRQILALVDRALQSNSESDEMKSSLLTMRDTVAKSAGTPALSVS